MSRIVRSFFWCSLIWKFGLLHYPCYIISSSGCFIVGRWCTNNSISLVMLLPKLLITRLLTTGTPTGMNLGAHLRVFILRYLVFHVKCTYITCKAYLFYGHGLRSISMCKDQVEIMVISSCIRAGPAIESLGLQVHMKIKFITSFIKLWTHVIRFWNSIGWHVPHKHPEFVSHAYLL